MRTPFLTLLTALVLPVLASSAPARAQQRVYDSEYDYGYDTRDHHDFARFRFGVSGVGGFHWERGPEIGMGGAQLRIGVQLGDMFAVYYMPTGLVGSIMDRPASADSIAGLLWNSAMAELTLANFVQIGAGPSLDFVWGCDRTYQREVVCDSNDPFFGVHGRVAITIGGHGPGRRGGFVISADVHPTFYHSDDVSLALLGGLGFELY